MIALAKQDQYNTESAERRTLASFPVQGYNNNGKFRISGFSNFSNLIDCKKPRRPFVFFGGGGGRKVAAMLKKQTRMSRGKATLILIAVLAAMGVLSSIGQSFSGTFA